MKIASVTFFDPSREIGGGSVPAQSFKEWCDLLWVNCEVVSCPLNANQLNSNYDAIFFNTPPRKEFDWQNLKIPFAIMIHDETDLYKYATFTEMVAHPLCRTLIHIDHDGHFYNRFHSNNVIWHPCCSPRNLIYPSNPAKSKSQILYAARIVEWKNAHLLKNFSKEFNQDATIIGRIDDHAYAQKNKIISFGFDSTPYEGCDVFWDLCGSKTNHMTVHRMNLAAFEAISNGLMPIINPKAIPQGIQDIFIEANPLSFSGDQLNADLYIYRANKEHYWSLMYEKLSRSYASFKQVQYRVVEIIEHLWRRK